MPRVPDAAEVPGVGVASLDGGARSTAQRAQGAIERRGAETQAAIQNAVKLGAMLKRRREERIAEQERQRKEDEEREREKNPGILKPMPEKLLKQQPPAGEDDNELINTRFAAQQAVDGAASLTSELRAKRQPAEDEAFATSVVTKARTRFPEVFLDSRNQATEGAEDFTPAFQRRLGEESDALIDAAFATGGRPSERAVQNTRDRLGLLGATFAKKAAVFENNARIGKLTGDLSGGLQALVAEARNDPERRLALREAADENIRGAASFLPPERLRDLRRSTVSAIARAAVEGVIARDPGLAAEMLEFGDFDEGLEAERKPAFLESAKIAQQLEQETLERETAADRRELRRDTDTALAKLRGGQPVAEIEALKGRARGLEDADTHAALRHAEDDRLFMRGFAQRPPAEQADRIAALEGKAERKPVETRRLAAMKAQAAVAERELAGDPLGYGLATGVIGEIPDIADLDPQALRARLRQAETAAEQFGLPSVPVLRPGEAKTIARGLSEVTPEELSTKAAELAELPVEIRQAIVEEVGARDSRLALDPTADGEIQDVSATDLGAVLLQGEGDDSEFPLPEPPALADVSPDSIAQRGRQAREERHREHTVTLLTQTLRNLPPAEVQADFDRLQEDFFLRTGDLLLADRLAMRRLREIWGIASDGPSLRIVRRSEAEGELLPLGAIRTLDADFTTLREFFLEVPEQLVGGLLDAVQNVIDPFDPSGKRRLPDVPPAKTKAGQVIRGAAQFLIGFIPAVRVLKVVGAAAKLAKGARTLGAGERASRAIGVALEAEIAAVLAGQAVLDPFEDRLSNFVEAHPEFRNPITAWLAADPDDSEAEARAKLAIEDLAVGLSVAFVPIIKALRAKGVKELPRVIDTERLIKVGKPNFDPKSGRQVFHDVDGVDEILRRAVQVREPFERTLKGIAEGLGRGVSFEATRVKELARLGEKLETRPTTTLGDYLGARLIANSPADLRSVVKRIGQKFEILHHDNFLMSPRPTGYRAVHLQVRLDNGISAEIQIIPTDIKNLPGDERSVFERWRKPNLTPQERAEVDELMKVTQADFQAAFSQWLARRR